MFHDGKGELGDGGDSFNFPLTPGALTLHETHLIDKEATQNQSVGACSHRKWRETFSGYALDHDPLKMNRSWSLCLCFAA
jgi:hypothetical protein